MIVWIVAGAGTLVAAVFGVLWAALAAASDDDDRAGRDDVPKAEYVVEGRHLRVVDDDE